MEKGFVKAITMGACALSIATTDVSINGTPVIPLVGGAGYKWPHYSEFNINETNSNRYFDMSNNIYLVNNTNEPIWNICEEFFGEMSDATQEEQKCVNDYIRSISKDTGVNFFDYVI